ncbi:MAG: Crp/Fnr family transcriptional regulator [Burkholderiales bacterium]
MGKATPLDPTGNYLLNKLARADYDLLCRDCGFETVRLEPEQIIYRHDEPIEHVYFPTTAMLSWIATTSEGERVEVGVVGWEGMVGIPEILGYESSPYAVEVELPGEAIRIKARQFKQEFARFSAIHGILFRYTYTALMQLAQSSACGRFHTVEERLCRWLLMAHDRSQTDELRLTQEILAGMIGARRPAVTLVVGVLQKAGLIRAGRGRITLLDRDRMEAAACECYPIIRRAFDQFLGLEEPPGSGTHTDANGGPTPPSP